MIVMSMLLTILFGAFVLFVVWLRWFHRSYAFGLALDEADRQEQRHYQEVENRAYLNSLEAQRTKAREEVEKIKASIRKDGLDPDRAIF